MRRLSSSVHETLYFESRLRLNRRSRMEFVARLSLRRLVVDRGIFAQRFAQDFLLPVNCLDEVTYYSASFRLIVSDVLYRGIVKFSRNSNKIRSLYIFNEKKLS